MVRIGKRKFKLGLRVGFDRPWLLRPASKVSTIGAYVLALIAIALHLF